MHRNRIPLLSVLLLLCGHTTAQTHVTSPTGLLGVEGDVESYLFGAYPSARHMLFDGEFLKSTMLVKEVAMRIDFRASTSTSSMGRTWSDVRLSVGEGDMDNIVPTFSLNPNGAPTRVFSGSITWPTNIGIPTNLPTKWTKLFPFGTTWHYTDNKDICLDFDFNGGTLANNAAWATSKIYHYFLDAFPSTPFNEAPQTYFGKSGTKGGCIDSAGSLPATNFLHCTAYGSNYHDAKYRGKHRLFTFSYFTARARPVVNVVNFVGIPSGFPFTGITCNLLYLDVRRFLLVNTRLASPTPGAWSGYIFPSGTPDGLVPINKAYTGLEIWAQAMFEDTQTKGLKLSRATMIKIPTEPRAVRRTALFQYNATAKSSYGYGPYIDPSHNPILRYAK